MISSRMARWARGACAAVVLTTTVAIGSAGAADALVATPRQAVTASVPTQRLDGLRPIAGGTATPDGTVEDNAGGSSVSGKGQNKGDDKKHPAEVTFGVRPAGAKAVDLRTTWTYQNLAPGQIVNDHAGFVNLTNAPVTLTVYAADAQNTAAGGFGVVPSKRSSLDLGTWISLGRNEVTVPAKSTVIMPFQLRIPRNAEPGDHAGGIMASFRTTAKDTKGNTVAIDNRVGTRVYARVIGPLKPRLSIEQVKTRYEGGGIASGSATVTFTVRNEGNVRLTGHQALRISDLFGGVVLAQDVPALPELLPKNSFTFNVRAVGLKPVSYFTALLTVDPQSITGNVDPALQQASYSTTFVGLSWPVLVIALAAALSLGFLLQRRLRGRRRRPKGGDGAPKPDAGKGPKSPADAGSATDPAGSRTPARAPVSAAGFAALGGTARRRPGGRGLLGGLALLGALVVAGPASLLLSAGPASAAGSSDVTFVPATGQDVTPMYAVVPAGCPAEAVNVIGSLKGKGFPAEGIVVIPNGPAGVRHDEGFGLPLQNALHNFAAMNGVTLSGPYALTVRCIDRLGARTFATFTGIITFTDSTHYTATAPKQPPNYGVPIAVLAQTFPELKSQVAAAGESAVPAASGAAGASSGPQPAPSGAAGAAGQAGSLPAGAQPVTSATTSTSDSGLNLWLPVVLLAGVVVGAAAFLRRRQPGVAAPARPAARKSTVSTPAVSWPDEQ